MQAASYALLIPLMKDDDHGLTTGLYSVSRGVGTALGPLLAGIAIEVLNGGFFAGTEGYQAMWGVCGGANMPPHTLNEKPGKPDSATVGT